MTVLTRQSLAALALAGMLPLAPACAQPPEPAPAGPGGTAAAAPKIRAEGGGDSEGRLRRAVRRQDDVVQRAEHLREGCPERPAAVLFVAQPGDVAAAGQAAGDHARRRRAGRVLLRRQDDDGLRAVAGPGGGRRRAADDRRAARHRVGEGGDLLPVRRRDRLRPVANCREDAELGLLCRPIEGGRRHADRHGGDRRRRGAGRAMDRRRRSSAAA